jgi:hypothetical protein
MNATVKPTDKVDIPARAAELPEIGGAKPVPVAVGFFIVGLVFIALGLLSSFPAMWLAGIVVVFVSGLSLAVRASRRSDGDK